MYVLAAAKLLLQSGENMPNFDTLIHQEDRIFQVAWESTLKCNLDCGYCGDGHDNKTEHPSLGACNETVDFIFKYVDKKMQERPQHARQANLNIQGGESLFHPHIVDILKWIAYKKKSINWYMGTAFITNAVVGMRQWKRISEYVDYYTISYHAESTDKQQQLVKNNILYCKENNINFTVNLMMHPKLWDNCIGMIEWCKDNNVPYHPRQLDHHWLDMRWNYSAEQTEYLLGRTVTTKDKLAHVFVKGLNLSAEGRACCGNKTLCASGCDTKYVDNHFKNWHCSVADHFLYIRQTTGEVFTNKDCRMNYDSKVGPIGNLNNTNDIFSKMHNTGIVCKKKSCWCGICAPKAKTKEKFDTMMADLNSQSL